jgi:non-ribosomal peptide synthetase component F
LSRKHQVSLYATLLAAFSLLVQHYTLRDNFVLGRGVAGRTSLETEKLIGCFINMVLLRLDLSGNPSFMQLQKRVQAVIDVAYANQDVPFVKLAASLQPESEPRRPPLAQIFFNLYTAPSANKIAGAQLEIFDLGDYRPADDVALFQDMILGMQDSGNRLIAELKYNRELFEVSAMEQLLEHYQTVLETIVAAPAQPIQELIRQTDIARPQPTS